MKKTGHKTTKYLRPQSLSKSVDSAPGDVWLFCGCVFWETFWAPPHKTVKISHSFMFRRWCGGRMSVARGRCACPVEPVLVPEHLNGLYGLVCVYNCC